MTASSQTLWFERFTILSEAHQSRDPLSFPGYRERLAAAMKRTGESESVTCGLAEQDGLKAIAVVFNFEFFGGSMGEATGQRIVDAIDLAIELRLPLLTVSASGGARMQEGILSLVQMQAIAAALSRLRCAGLPHLAVARHPTTGGVWVALVSAADVILAERGAAIAFAGTRVRSSSCESPDFKAEGKLVAGAVDAIINTEELADAVTRYLRVLTVAIDGPCEQAPVPWSLKTGRSEGENNGWRAVKAARSPDRPRARSYLAAYFDELISVSGDRVSGRDQGMECGIGVRGTQAVAYIAQGGRANSPAGFRTACRLVRLAEQLRIPILTLIDTAGADDSPSAEAMAIGTAIGQLLQAITSASVPVTSLLIGEGGSGGALALASPGNLWVIPESYFSVLVPEGAAAILYRDPGRAEDAANALGVDSERLVELGIARDVAAALPF